MREWPNDLSYKFISTEYSVGMYSVGMQISVI